MDFAAQIIKLHKYFHPTAPTVLVMPSKVITRRMTVKFTGLISKKFPGYKNKNMPGKELNEKLGVVRTTSVISESLHCCSVVCWHRRVTTEISAVRSWISGPSAVVQRESLLCSVEGFFSRRKWLEIKRRIYANFCMQKSRSCRNIERKVACFVICYVIFCSAHPTCFTFPQNIFLCQTINSQKWDVQTPGSRPRSLQWSRIFISSEKLCCACLIRCPSVRYLKWYCMVTHHTLDSASDFIDTVSSLVAGFLLNRALLWVATCVRHVAPW